MSDETLEKKPAQFLTDEEDLENDVEYVKPNIETKLPAHKRKECRDIVQEIRSFGISQRQYLYLVYLLSLELENREIMLELTKVVGKNREKIPVSRLVID